MKRYLKPSLESSVFKHQQLKKKECLFEKCMTLCGHALLFIMSISKESLIHVKLCNPASTCCILNNNPAH